MNIKCPICQTQYHVGPGKYRCRCGAKFFVKEPEVVLDSAADSREDSWHRVSEKDVCHSNGRGRIFLCMFICILAGLGIGFMIFKYIGATQAVKEEAMLLESQDESLSFALDGTRSATSRNADAGTRVSGKK